VTTTDRKRVLTLALPDVPRAKLEPFLRRAALEVNRLASPARALELLREVPFHLVIVGHPLPDLTAERFVRALRAGDSASRHAGLLVITASDPRPELLRLVGHGVNRVVAATEPAEVLLREAAELLEVEPRVRTRALVRAEIECGLGTAAFLAQTENVSATGALIRSERRPALGTRLPIRLQLPDDPAPIECTGEVVRHADRDREGVSGFAVRFVDLTPSQRQRLESWVLRHLDAGG